MLFAALCLRLRPHLALLASRLPPAVDADAHAPALLALRLLPAVDADAHAPALLALRLLPAVDADAHAPTLLALRLPPAVDADAHAPTPLALRLPPRVDTHRCTTTTRLASRPFPIMQARGVFSLHFAVLALRLPKVVGLWRCLVLADSSDAALSQSVLSAQIRIRGPVSQGHRIALVIRHLVHPLALCRHFQWN
jgi:hypothetical protein